MLRNLRTLAIVLLLGGPFLCWGLPDAPALPTAVPTALPAPVATAPPRLPETRGPVPAVTLPATVVPAVTPTP